MKASRYNHCFQSSEGNVVFNSLSKSFVEMSESDYKALEGEDWGHFDKDELSMLYSNGFAVDDSFDERAFLSYQLDRSRYSTELFSLTIAPTLSCNFACPYCYESPRSGFLDEDGLNAILEFVEDNYRLNRFRKMQVNWYGGEPMLCISRIADWSAKFISFCEKHEVDYLSHMITNGSLVNEGNISLIKASRITNVQVTIDGWADRHDRRRPARNGEPQFATILSAIELLAENGIEVSCRMNVDENNISDYERVAERFSGCQNVYVHVGHLRDYEPLDQEEFNCFSCSSFSAAELEIFKSSGYTLEDFKNIFSNRRLFCGACTENSYVVDERCNVYKCWNDIGNSDAVIFNLLEDAETRRVNYGPLLKYMKWDPFADSSCSRCKWMPICGGGCVFETAILGEPFCYPPVYSIDDYLSLYYEEVKRNEAGQES